MAWWCVIPLPGLPQKESFMVFPVTQQHLTEIEQFITSRGAKISGDEVTYHGAKFKFTFDPTAQTVEVAVEKYPIVVSHAYVDAHISDLFTKPLA